MDRLTLASCFFLTIIPLVHGTISERAMALALDWAPVYWMHPEEVFYPSSAEFFIENMEVRNSNEEVVQPRPTGATIVSGEETENFHLNTFEDIQCVNCFEDHFYGERPLSQVPVYIHVREYSDSCSTIDVKYSVFYPYNYGKDVCIGVPTEDCLGYDGTFGNHVGDWEGADLRFRHGRPVDLHLGAHSFGATYVFDELTDTFVYVDGEQMIEGLDPDSAEDAKDARIDLVIDYPQTIYLTEGNHLELFSANGSHGTWGDEGDWTYLQVLFVNLVDITAKGDALRSWENPVFIDNNLDPDEFDGTDLQWVNFRGAFGNVAKLNCRLEAIAQECGLEDAVSQPGAPGGSFADPQAECAVVPAKASRLVSTPILALAAVLTLCNILPS